MYGAMREHAPSSTRLAGIVTAAAVTAAMASALAMGMGNYIAKAPLEPLMFTALPDAPPPETPPETDRQLDMTNSETLALPSPDVDLPIFRSEDPPIVGRTDPPLRAALGPAIAATPAPPTRQAVRITAKLVPGAPPPYPAADVRRGNEGVSTLQVCLDVRGRVTSASLAGSSGHRSLDQAALKWVRDAKFSPAKVDGSPQAVCGHAVDYEWTLNTR